MSSEPGSGDDHDWPNWREETRLLDISGHEIRIIREPQLVGDLDAPHIDPAVFADFDPPEDGPDDDIWPLTHYDPGTTDKTEDLVTLQSPFPAPNVAFVSTEYLKALRGSENPFHTKVRVGSLPPWDQPDDASPDDITENTVISGRPSVPNTGDRAKFLDRYSRLWNGKIVRGHHLLRDKCPNWDNLFGDLNQEELQRLSINPSTDETLVEAFGDHDWFNNANETFVRTVTVFRKDVRYGLTNSLRNRINGYHDAPDLRGDPMEGLIHRITVGLAALFHAAQNRTIRTYENFNGYSVDLIAVDDDGEGEYYFHEVITGHKNNKHHRKTYRKFMDLDAHGTALATFDTRSSAKRILNHWHDNCPGELPLGKFGSEPPIEWGREKIEEAYQDEETDWHLASWDTTDWLRRQTIDRDGPDLQDDFITSVTW